MAIALVGDPDRMVGDVMVNVRFETLPPTGGLVRAFEPVTNAIVTAADVTRDGVHRTFSFVLARLTLARFYGLDERIIAVHRE